MGRILPCPPDLATQAVYCKFDSFWNVTPNFSPSLLPLSIYDETEIMRFAYGQGSSVTFCYRIWFKCQDFLPLGISFGILSLHLKYALLLPSHGY